MILLVFVGFLGSGKTTLILDLARQLAADGRRTCIIVNEVGEIGIDQQVLGESGMPVRELVAGCICCQITVDLITTLQEVAAAFAPDIVLIEASGVAAPPAILEALSYYPGEPLAAVHTVTVVDPTRFEALHEVLQPLIESQIATADRIVITKIDEAGVAQVAETERTVRRLNTGAPVDQVSPGHPLELSALLPGAYSDRGR